MSTPARALISAYYLAVLVQAQTLYELLQFNSLISKAEEFVDCFLPPINATEGVHRQPKVVGKKQRLRRFLKILWFRLQLHGGLYATVASLHFNRYVELVRDQPLTILMSSWKLFIKIIAYCFAVFTYKLKLIIISTAVSILQFFYCIFKIPLSIIQKILNSILLLFPIINTLIKILSFYYETIIKSIEYRFLLHYHHIKYVIYQIWAKIRSIIINLTSSQQEHNKKNYQNFNHTTSKSLYNQGTHYRKDFFMTTTDTITTTEDNENSPKNITLLNNEFDTNNEMNNINNDDDIKIPPIRVHTEDGTTKLIPCINRRYR